ncbi:hypothetical protein FACS1894170_01710 [Planctomycetales bacterium]|nr:hypothetical protein FACS1894170_01710 [Planctomycetales bacterium]
MIIDIPLLKKVRIDGKIYNMNVRKENLLKFRNFEKEQREKRGKETYLKVGRQYAEEKPNNRFDIFDIIFPILQPPLGNEFNNPIIFPANPYPFQVIGIKFLMEHTAALLGDEMGLGKTVQTITAIRALMRQGKILTACVICPKAVLSNWERELWKWSPELRIIKIEGLKHKRESQWQMPSHIYICTYEALRNDFDMVDKHSRKKNKKSKTHFDLIVLDEIQKTKNPAAALTRTVRSIDANYRWGLSGTPLENGINDLITICETLKPDMFDNLIGNDWGMGIDAVKDAYKPYFLRRKAKDVLTEMPEKNTQEVWLDLLSEQQKRYNTAESTGIIELEEKGDSVTRIDALALITKLKLICNYDDRSKESVKLDYLKEELEEITEDGKKALVFSQFPNETLKKIEPDLHEYKPFIYDGSLSDRKRTQYVDDFQNLDENKIMMLSSKAGNAGITLTRANYVYHFDLWWNPAVAAQSLGRALRIGQKEKVVFERYLLTKGTIEERIYLKVQGKRQLFDRIVDDLSDETAIAKNFTDAEIFGLLGLKNPKNPKPITAIETFTDVPFEPKTQQQIDTMAPLEFEEFICLLYEKRDYHVLLTQKSYDGGVDILAKRQAASGYEEICIQCKHKENSNDSVGVKEVREFSTAVKDYNPSAKAVLVTNGIFSNEAEISARRNNIELINGANLQGLMKKIKME